MPWLSKIIIVITSVKKMSEVMSIKQCVKCKSTKHIDDFYNNKSTSDKKQVWCRSCQDAANLIRVQEKFKLKREYLECFREQRQQYVNDHCSADESGYYDGDIRKYQHYPLHLQDTIYFLLHHDLKHLITFKHTEHVKQQIAAYYKTKEAS